MKLANSFIFGYTNSLYEILNNQNLKFPAQVNYVINKNFKNLYSLYQELDEARNQICATYSTGVTEEGAYLFEDDEKRIKAETELNELMAITQEVNIVKFKIASLGDIQLTGGQMETLMFMIEEESEGQE